MDLSCQAQEKKPPDQESPATTNRQGLQVSPSAPSLASQPTAADTAPPLGLLHSLGQSLSEDAVLSLRLPEPLRPTQTPTAGPAPLLSMGPGTPAIHAVIQQTPLIEVTATIPSQPQEASAPIQEARAPIPEASAPIPEASEPIPESSAPSAPIPEASQCPFQKPARPFRKPVRPFQRPACPACHFQKPARHF